MDGIRNDLGFSDPVLNELTFKINKDFDEDSFEGIDNLKYDLTLKESNQENKDKVKSNTLAIFKLSIGAESEKYPFSLVIEYQAEFFWSKESNIEEKSFLKINTASILYSYCRPIVHNITGLSKLPSLNLPFYNFTVE